MSISCRAIIESLEARRLLSAVDVLTYHYDNARTWLNDSETILNPTDLTPATFGKLFVDSVDGKVDAQPLYVAHVNIPNKGVHNVLYVETENDSVYAFDADSNAGMDAQPLMQASLLGPGEVPSDDRGSGQISPTIGITATPVIDVSSGTMYVTAMSKLVSGTTTTYIQRLHALSMTTLQDKVPPVTVQASISSTGPNSVNGTLAFIPANYAERAALTLINGTVYTTWTSHSDENIYNGWIIGYDAKTLKQNAVLNVTPDGVAGSFWGSGAGPAVDARGNIYDLDANGTFDTTLNSRGFPIHGDFGGTFIKVSTTPKLAVTDYFAPDNIAMENNTDEDLGSGGVIVLPDMTNARGKIVQLAIGAGKDGNIYLVNRNDLGHFNPANDNGIYQELPGALPSGEWATSAYFNGSVYFGPILNHLMQFTFVKGRLMPLPTSQSPGTFGYPGTTPSVSANGTSDGIVWAAEAAANGQAVLHAYNAANLADELYNSTMAGSRDAFGEQNKFITPVVTDGKVYVATTNGVGVFGMLPATALPAGWTDSDIGNTRVAGSAGFDGTTWTIAGGGTGIGGRADALNFASQSVSGNQDLLARVTGISGGGPAAGAGVMFRASDAARSIFASLTATAKGLVFQWRGRTGGNANAVKLRRVRSPSAANPLWLEIQRTGNTFTAVYSTDGVTFKRIGKPVTLSRFASGALAGLAVTAHAKDSLAAATFDSVTV